MEEELCVCHSVVFGADVSRGVKVGGQAQLCQHKMGAKIKLWRHWSALVVKM